MGTNPVTRPPSDRNTPWLHQVRPGQQDALRRMRSHVDRGGFDWKIGNLKAKKIFVEEFPMAIKCGRPLEATVRFSPLAKIGVTEQTSVQLDLTVRPRRNRQSEWVRRMVREHVLTADDLIWPLFLVDGERKRVPVASMPGVERISIDEAVRDVERAAKLRIPCIALFPYTDPSLPDHDCTQPLNPHNLACRAIRAITQ